MKRTSLVVVMTITVAILAWHQAAVFPSYAEPKNDLVFFDIQPDVYQTGVQTEAVVIAKLREPAEFVLGSGSVQKCNVSGGHVVDATCHHFGDLISQQTSPTDLRGTFTFQFTQPISTIAFRIKIAVKRTGLLISPADTVMVGRLVTPDQVATGDLRIPSPTNPNLAITLQQNSVGGAGVLVAVESAPLLATSIGGQVVEATVNVTLVSATPEAAPVTKPAILEIPASAGTPDGTKYWMVRAIVADGSNGGLTQRFLTVDTGTAQSGVIFTDNGNNPGDPNPILQNTNRLLEGLFGSAEVTLLKFAGTGVAQGRVCADVDDIGTPVVGCPAGSAALRRHVWVQNKRDVIGNPVPDSDAQGFFTNVAGQYRVPITAPNAVSNNYEIKAIDGFRCASGSSFVGTLSGTKTLVSPDGGGASPAQDDNTLAIALNQYQAPTRFGIRNPGFELRFSQEKCWVKGGSDLGDSDAAVRRISGGASPSTLYRDLFGFGTAISAKNLGPDDANDAMAAITANASIEQSFMVPAGVDSLLFDFNFGCLASNATCGDATNNYAALKAVTSRLDIQLVAQLVLPAGSTPSGPIMVSAPLAPLTMRNFSGQLGWRTGKLALGGIQVPNPTTGLPEPLSGSQRQITIRFTVSNLAGASSIEPAVFLDNIRFQDVVFVVHIMSGAGTNKAQVREQVRALNEIGSQTGKQVRIRRINDPVNPTSGFPAGDCNAGNLNLVIGLDYFPPAPVQGYQENVSNNHNFRTQSISNLMCFGNKLKQPGDPASDIQVYYVKSFEDGTAGLAVTAEDYWGDDQNSAPNTVDAFGQITGGFTNTPNSPIGFIVKDLNDETGLLGFELDGFRLRKFETAFHELGHGGMATTRVNSNEEHWAVAGTVMTQDICYPVPATEDRTYCSSRPIVLSNQSDVFVPPAPPKRGICLEGC